MRTPLKSALPKTQLYPATEEVYRHALDRDFLRSRKRAMGFRRESAEAEQVGFEKAVDRVAYRTTLGEYNFNITMSPDRGDDVPRQPGSTSPGSQRTHDALARFR